MFPQDSHPPTLPFRAPLEGFSPAAHQVRCFTSESELHGVNPSHLKLSGGGKDTVNSRV